MTESQPTGPPGPFRPAALPSPGRKRALPCLGARGSHVGRMRAVEPGSSGAKEWPEKAVNCQMEARGDGFKPATGPWGRPGSKPSAWPSLIRSPNVMIGHEPRGRERQLDNERPE